MAFGNDGELKIKTSMDNSEVATGLGTLKSLVGTGMAALVAKQAISFGKMGIQYDAMMQDYKANFKVLLGSADKANQHVAMLKKMAASTPFEMSDLASASQQMLAFGVSAKNIKPDLQMLGDISLGNKEKFSSLGLVFGQVSSQGKLMGQDLLQFINAGFNPLKELSKMGYGTYDQLKEQMSQGKISFDMVSAAMEHATSKGGQFYKGMETASKTWNGRISTLKDNLNELLGDTMLPIFNFLSKLLVPLTSLVGFAEKHVAATRSILIALGIVFTEVFAVSTITKFGSAIASMAGGVGKAFTALFSLPGGLGIILVIAAVVAAIASYVHAVGGLSKAHEILKKKLETFFTELPQKVEALAKAIPEKMTAMAKLLAENAPKIVTDIMNAIITYTPQILLAVGKMILAIITTIWTLKGAILKGIIESIPSILTALVGVLTAILNGLSQMLGRFALFGLKMIAQILVGIGNGAIGLIGYVITLGARIVSALARGLVSVAGIALKRILTFLTGYVRGWASIIRSVVSFAKSLPGRIRSGLGSLGSIGRNFISGLLSGMKGYFSHVYSSITNFGSKVKSKLKKIFKINSPSKYTAWIGQMLMEGLSGGIEDNTDGVLNTLDAGMTKVKAAFSVDPLNLTPSTAQISATGSAITSPNVTNNQVEQNINIYQPVKSPADVERAIRHQAITIGLAGI